MAKATKPAKVKAANKIKPAGKANKTPDAKLKAAKTAKKKVVLPLPGRLGSPAASTALGPSVLGWARLSRWAGPCCALPLDPPC